MSMSLVCFRVMELDKLDSYYYLLEAESLFSIPYIWFHVFYHSLFWTCILLSVRNLELRSRSPHYGRFTLPHQAHHLQNY